MVNILSTNVLYGCPATLFWAWNNKKHTQLWHLFDRCIILFNMCGGNTKLTLIKQQSRSLPSIYHLVYQKNLYIHKNSKTYFIYKAPLASAHRRNMKTINFGLTCYLYWILLSPSMNGNKLYLLSLFLVEINVGSVSDNQRK